MIGNIKILVHQGKQYIPDVRNAEVPGIFRGIPFITDVAVDVNALLEVCPTEAISDKPVSIDLGKCTFCGECAQRFPSKVKFSKDHKMATNSRNNLVVIEKDVDRIRVNPDIIRKEIKTFFRGSLKLRQISAGGDNSSELELNACGNVNFDMGRFGIEFVASPRHADGIVITGPITKNMAAPLQRCYDAIPSPKIIILAGTDAISGGLFSDSPALDRSFLDKYPVDLYVPGSPIHPLTFINGVLDLIQSKG